MFKKIEIWILYLTILLGIILAFGFGVLVRQEIEGVTKQGSIDISFLSKPAANIARLPERFVKTLFNPSIINNAFFGENRYFFNQVSFDGTPNSDESYLLLSRYDADLEEGVVELVDLTNFKVLHSWNPDIDSFNNLVEQVDEFEHLKRDTNNKRSYLVHPKLTTDGGLLFQDSSPLRKIDSCSELVFQNTDDIFHHSIETDIDGNIWSPSHMYPQTLPTKKVGRGLGDFDFNYYDDAIVKLSSDGEVLYQKSVSQIFLENGLEYLLFAVVGNKFEVDPIHLNDIQPVLTDGPHWKRGDIFLSLRNQSMVILYRPSTNKIIWKGVGHIAGQHDVDILDDYRISIFNNNAMTFFDGDEVDGNNEVVIYDFKTDSYSKYFDESLKQNDVRTITNGRSEILPNGNLFIEESIYGRILYFNKDGSLRWTYVNSSKKGKIGRLAWSRILYTLEEIQTVNNFLNNRKCNG